MGVEAISLFTLRWRCGTLDLGVTKSLRNMCLIEKTTSSVFYSLDNASPCAELCSPFFLGGKERRLGSPSDLPFYIRMLSSQHSWQLIRETTREEGGNWVRLCPSKEFYEKPFTVFLSRFHGHRANPSSGGLRVLTVESWLHPLFLATYKQCRPGK